MSGPISIAFLVAIAYSAQRWVRNRPDAGDHRAKVRGAMGWERADREH